MVEPELTIVFDIAFEKALRKLKNPLKEQAKKQIKKIIDRPTIGKVNEIHKKRNPRSLHRLVSNVLYLP